MPFQFQMTPPPFHSACAFVLALFASAHSAAQPGGRSIQGSGVVPDPIVADPSAQGTLQAAIASLQK
ncbi:hypothetical protein [Paracidovorax cattleyae]|uniref:Uncharacterized protein n=1 Tax=Paracidovorax cattleyae TaxID=80868 RepID=A0A1H0PP76_9BURK|nr:hypothetical protein [Paracidovorax cattleyae]SDP06961.1 hypothetical protein SAMN04489708_1072 [Paracidovorax cattleyae]